MPTEFQEDEEQLVEVSIEVDVEDYYTSDEPQSEEESRFGGHSQKSLKSKVSGYSQKQ